MKACSLYREELAACAATDEVPNAQLAAHLENCAACRNALDELRSVSEIHLRVADRLQEPKRSLSLSTLFLNSIRSGEGSSIRSVVRPALILSTIAACVLALLVIQNSRKELRIATIASTETPKAERSWEPSWQRFREEASLDTLGVGPVGGFASAPYRVKDAYSDLN